MKAVKSEPKVRIVVASAGKKTSARRRKRATPPITINPERLGGTPTIAGTRLPVVTLIDYLNDERSIKNFLEDFDGVTYEDAQAVIQRIRDALEEGWLAEPVDY
jgi:uncharacterized protein (DUF433 family)